MQIRFGAIEKFSTIDYPGKLACVLFLKGCNFRCGFCYNKQLVLPELLDSRQDIPEKEIQEFLDSRKGLLDSVVVSGGEPTIYGLKLIQLFKTIKDKGYLVKLDTNGSNPKLVKTLIEMGLVDYIAMDLKDDFENYNRYTRVQASKVKQCLELLKVASVPHEFRVTTHPQLSLEGFREIIKLTEGQKLFVQDFMNVNTIQDYKNCNTIYSKLSSDSKDYILR